MTNTTASVSDEEALLFHSSGRPGKLQISPTKPLTTQRDLSLAYSPERLGAILAVTSTNRQNGPGMNAGNSDGSKSTGQHR